MEMTGAYACLFEAVCDITTVPSHLKGRKTSRDQSHFPVARATYTVQVEVFNSARAVVQSRLCSNPSCSSQITQTQGSRSRRVGRRARRVFALFPQDSTFNSHRWQFARSFQKVFPPPHFLVKNTTTVFFFSVRQKLKKVQCKAQVNLPKLPSLES